MKANAATASLPKIDPARLRAALLDLPLEELEKLNFFAQWRTKARKEQLPPLPEPSNDNEAWRTWIALAGRGFGKTRMGSHWICEKALLIPKTPCAVIAPTHTALLDLNFDGPSGIFSILSKTLIKDYVKSPLPTITLYNESTIKGYSAQEPERLRGPNWSYALLDEFAAWQYMQMAYDMIRMCLRVGDNPQMMITTTPKPMPMLRRLLGEDGVVVTRGSTHDNKANLAPSFFKEVTKYAGTQIGKQEIEGELLDFEESGIFKRSWIKIWPNKNPDGTPKKFPKLLFIIQSYDTAYKLGQANDPSAGSTWGVFRPYDDRAETAIMLLDCWAERLAYPELRAKLRSEYDVVYTDEEKHIDIVLIEDKSSGQALIPDLQRAGVPVEAYHLPPDSDKIQRAHAVSHLAKRYIWVPESTMRGKEWQGTKDQVLAKPMHPRKWCLPFIDQLTMFGPDSFREMEKMRRKAVADQAVMDAQKDDLTMHDDWVDTFTQALAWLRDSEWLQLPADNANMPEPEEQKKLVNPYG